MQIQRCDPNERLAKIKKQTVQARGRTKERELKLIRQAYILALIDMNKNVTEAGDVRVCVSFAKFYGGIENYGNLDDVLTLIEE